MPAQLLTAFGGPESFHLTDILKPELKPGMVLVRLAATSDSNNQSQCGLLGTCRAGRLKNLRARSTA
jgi:hypothetical protein